MEDAIGVGISKGALDAYLLSSHEQRQFCNDTAGVKALSLWARDAGVSRVISEATAVYHRCVETGLAQHEFSFARVCQRRSKNQPAGRSKSRPLVGASD